MPGKVLTVYNGTVCQINTATVDKELQTKTTAVIS